MESMQDLRDRLRKSACKELGIKDVNELSDYLGKKINLGVMDDPAFTTITSIEAYYAELQYSAGEGNLYSHVIYIQTNYVETTILKESSPREQITLHQYPLALRLVNFEQDDKAHFMIQKIHITPGREPSWHKTPLQIKHSPSSTDSAWHDLAAVQK